MYFDRLIDDMFERLDRDDSTEQPTNRPTTGTANCRNTQPTRPRRRRIFEALEGICGYCRKPVEGAYEIDHLVPLALGGADDDGGNTVPMHPERHRIKIPGRRRGQDGGDSRRLAKMQRLRMSRSDGPPRPPRSLSRPLLVRSPDGSVYVRDGTERKMR